MATVTPMEECAPSNTCNAEEKCAQEKHAPPISTTPNRVARRKRLKVTREVSGLLHSADDLVRREDSRSVRGKIGTSIDPSCTRITPPTTPTKSRRTSSSPRRSPSSGTEALRGVLVLFEDKQKRTPTKNDTKQVDETPNRPARAAKRTRRALIDDLKSAVDEKETVEEAVAPAPEIQPKKVRAAKRKRQNKNEDREKKTESESESEAKSENEERETKPKEESEVAQSQSESESGTEKETKAESESESDKEPPRKKTRTAKRTRRALRILSDSEESDVDASFKKPRVAKRKRRNVELIEKANKKYEEEPLEVEPTAQLTVENVIEAYREMKELLQISASVNTVKREEEKEEVKEFWLGRLEKQQGGCVYISGSPGTGKTASMREVAAFVKRYEKRLAKDSSTCYRPSRMIEINGMEIPGDDPLSTVIKHRLLRGKKDNGKDETLDLTRTFAMRHYLTKEANDTMTVLIIDELDQLTYRPKFRDELMELFDIATQENSTLLLIGIANALSLEQILPQLKANKFSAIKEMTFSSYDPADMVAILEQRSQMSSYPNLFDAVTFKICAAHTAKYSGDARKLLALCRETVDVAERELNGKYRGRWKSILPEFPKITAAHAMAAVRTCSDRASQKSDTILRLPVQQQMLLCVAVAMAGDSSLLDPLELRRQFRRLTTDVLKSAVSIEATYRGLIDGLLCANLFREETAKDRDGGTARAGLESPWRSSNLMGSIKVLVDSEDLKPAIEAQRILKDVWGAVAGKGVVRQTH